MAYTYFSQPAYPTEVLRKHLDSVGLDPDHDYYTGPPAPQDEKHDDRIFVFRCVVMNPWLGISIDASGMPNHEDSLPKEQIQPFVSGVVDLLKDAVEEVRGHLDKAVQFYRALRRR